jgi:Tat protein secretion system quality control protein TatD with DNase activity
MKISITTNNKVFSVEDELGFDCTSIDEAVEMFKGLLVCAGFHPCNVDDAFNTECTWFTEQERNDNLQGHTKEEVQEWQNSLFKQNEDDEDYVF